MRVVGVILCLVLGALSSAASAQAVSPTTFATLSQPYGITTDASDNVFVTSDGVFTTYLSKFSPGGQELDAVSIGGPTVGELGRLATDPATGDIWDLSINGTLRIVDPDTLDLRVLGDLSDIDLSASSTHVWDALYGGFFDRSGSILPWYSTFGDIALYRSANNTRLDVFVTARNTGYNVPYVARLTWVNDVFQGATALMTSTAIYPVNVPRGIAVGPSGTVVTTLPRIGRLGADFTEQVISFPAGFPEHGVPKVELDQWDESSRGISSDAAGNYYLTSQINSSLCGFNAGASVMVLSPAREFRACHPHSLLGSGEDVAVTAAGDHVYSTVLNEGRVLDWGRLANSGRTLSVQRSGSGGGTVTSTPAGISCGTACGAAFDDGAQVTLHATPASGSAFSGWSGGGCSGTGDCVLTMDADRSVTATFSPVGRQLAVTKSGFGGGTVTSTPDGISCGAACGAGFDDGAQVTLHAAPASGSLFNGWSGSGCSGTGDCVLTMDADRSVTATFSKVSRQLTLTKSGSGTGTVTSAPAGINCGSACSMSFDDGAQVTLHAAPASGSLFNGWNGGGCSGTGDCFVTVDGDKPVSAAFVLDVVGPGSPPGGTSRPASGTHVDAPSIRIFGANGRTVRVPANRLLTLPDTSVSCPAAGQHCSGTAVVTTATAVAAKVEADRRRKITLGRASFGISPGSSWKARIKLSRKGMRVLRKLKSVRAAVKISAGDGSRSTTTKISVRLRAPRGR